MRRCSNLERLPNGSRRPLGVPFITKKTIYLWTFPNLSVSTMYPGDQSMHNCFEFKLRWNLKRRERRCFLQDATEEIPFAWQTGSSCLHCLSVLLLASVRMVRPWCYVLNLRALTCKRKRFIFFHFWQVFVLAFNWFYDGPFGHRFLPVVVGSLRSLAPLETVKWIFRINKARNL